MRSEISLVELGEELTRIAAPSAIAPLPVIEVEALGEVIGAPLPDEFRSFLLEFGVGVRPGPLLDLEWIIDETQREQQRFLEDPDVAVSPREPFPISPADAQRLPQLAADGIEPILWLDKPMPGTMFLCGHGCTWISMLALNGELAGTVWMTEMGWAEDMYWWPSAPWNEDKRWGYPYSGWTQPVPFLDWYIRWTRRNVAWLQSRSQ
ncbi:SMI1/KNR4 family protein [Streptosporangium sp. KLBMP 9127]|nr:SMI1/KNR4 family protein [Streptosporangium sp. KLBMP 9127]